MGRIGGITCDPLIFIYDSAGQRNAQNIQNVFNIVMRNGIIISSGGINDERIILIKLFCEGN